MQRAGNLAGLVPDRLGHAVGQDRRAFQGGILVAGGRPARAGDHPVFELCQELAEFDLALILEKRQPEDDQGARPSLQRPWRPFGQPLHVGHRLIARIGKDKHLFAASRGQPQRAGIAVFLAGLHACVAFETCLQGLKLRGMFLEQDNPVAR